MYSKLFIFFLLTSMLIGCKKKTEVPNVPAPDTLKNGILVLNEGLFNHNNSTLSWVNLSDLSVNNSFFEDKNQRGLGDTGNDIERYGNKVYVIVNVSSTLEILDATTGKVMRQVVFQKDNKAQQPRSIAFSGKYAFISSYDGYVNVLDTASLTIIQYIKVGANPEGLTVSNNRLFVCNSGGLNFPNVDSTVSVIDLSNFQEMTRIVIGKNPGGIITASNGTVYAISRGDYGSDKPKMHKINPVTNERTKTFGFEARGMTHFNEDLLIIHSDGGSGNSEIGVFNCTSETFTNPSLMNTSGIKTLYGLHHSKVKKRIYCMDANGYTTSGKIHVFDESGNFQQAIGVGLNPSKILVYE